MSYTEYQKAQKMGERTYKSCISSGSYPYLPVLEDMLSKEKSESQVSLGLVEIPIELIAGTYTSGRTTAFSSDFMPLLEVDTEFGSKWSHLYDSLYEHGQRDPITAFEYLNRFYIVEGNKRVSVQKYMGAVTIEGNVTRIIPHKDDSKENKIYYEFLDFYSKAKINYILMSHEGSFDKLFNYIHPENDNSLTEDELREFKFVYNLFKKEYLERGGNKLPITVGDALLVYIEIFGYNEIKNKNSTQIKKDIQRIWSEFRMISEEKPFSLITYPTEQSQKISFSKLIPVGTQPLKVAFVYYKEPLISGWCYCHELGREHISAVFGERIETTAFSTYDSSDIDLLERIIEQGYKLIFTATPVLSSISLKCAIMHPDVIILNCSINSAFRHMRSYYLRIYEAKFIIGAIAGSMTESNKIGYMADYPIFGMPASVNAFALGVKLVNPRAMVYLDWSTLKNHNPYENFSEKGVDLISNKDINAPIQESRDYGLYGLYGDAKFNIAAPVWDWGKMYEELVRSVLNGGWKNDDSGEVHGLNYYWGMSSGAIDILYSNKIPDGTKQLVYMLKNQIKSEAFNPFSGIIHSQSGTLMNSAEDEMTAEEIVNIDWFVDNISGEIPSKDKLDEGCHQLISQLGIKKE